MDHQPELSQSAQTEQFNFKTGFWILVLITTIFRFALAAHLGLGDDEAYYWEWANFLSWSYYDHPGMTAWLIWSSEHLFGHSPFAVRFPAVLLNTLSWILVWQFTEKLFSPVAAFVAALAYLLIPIFSLGGLMMVPDVPMSFFWILVMSVGWRTLVEGDDPKWGWISLGILMGLGTLSKYTMVLSGASLFFFLIMTPRTYRHLKTPWPYFSILIWMISCAPILVWNQHHHWASLHFQFTGRVAGQTEISFTRWAQFWLSQVGLLTPAVFFLFALTLVFALRHIRDVKWRYILCFSLPTLSLFAFEALKTEFKPHWPAPAYIALLIGSGYLCTTWHTKVRWTFTVLAMVFLLPLNVLFYTETVYPLVPKLYRALQLKPSWNPQWDPTNDLYGWPEAAQYALNLQKELGRTKEGPPFLATHRYQLSSSLAFSSQERVWNFSDGIEGYDFLQEPQDYNHLIGRNGIVIGDNRYADTIHMDQFFKRCKELAPLEIKRKQETARTFYFWYCQKFRGLPDKLAKKKALALDLKVSKNSIDSRRVLRRQ